MNVSLLGLEVDVDVPQVESFGIAVDDTLKDGPSSLRIPQTVLELSELSDGLDVCRRNEDDRQWSDFDNQ